MDVSSIAFERSQTGFHYLFRDVSLLTVANSSYDRVNRYMMTEERLVLRCVSTDRRETIWSRWHVHV